MEKFKKILLFYILGTVLAFWVLAIIHLNYSLLKEIFWRSSWRFVCKNTILSGAPIGTPLIMEVFKTNRQGHK